MSCQQVSRLITATATISSTTTTTTTAAGTITLEDPYVFTESVPNTPPILFTAQKTRPRLADTPGNAVTSAQPLAVTTAATLTKPPTIVQQKLPLTPQNGNAVAQGAPPNVAMVPNLKNFTTPPQTQLRKQGSGVPQAKRVSPNVCIVRPQQQQPQPQQRPEPPLILQHTPSLWQTPLLLEPAPTKPSPAVVHSPRTSLQLHSPVTAATAAPLMVSVACASPTATAMVSPLMPTAAVTTLPPSRFHHNTLAQHLQKVECLKKPKKSASPNAIAPAAPPPSAQSQTTRVVAGAQPPPPLQAFEAPQHSDPDLNDIPVNVIFRKPQPAGADAASGGVQPATVVADGNCTGAAPVSEQRHLGNIDNHQAGALKATTAAVVRTAATPASTNARDVVFAQPLAKPQLLANMHATSSMSTQVVTVDDGAACVLPIAAPLNSRSLMQTAHVTAARGAAPLKTMPVPRKTPQTKRKSIAKTNKAGLGLSAATYKKGRKCINAAIASLLVDDRAKFMVSAGGSTTAVAVVKMSSAAVAADTTLLASATVLPYCVQRHWLNVYDAMPADGSSCGREERIAQHKHQLRRQALQMLSSRSLQHKPLQAARQRLLCVDRLLRKYHDHSANGQPAVQCAVAECHERPLDMATYCQRHILHSAEQQLFVACAAKFPDNVRCGKPVFSASHDLAFCSEHAKLSSAPTFEALLPTMPPAHCGDAQPQQQRTLTLQQAASLHVLVGSSPKSDVEKPTPPRKRKVGTGNPVGRPLKRPRKSPIRSIPAATLPPLSAVLQRKSSTTSLESIASNSYSSNSQPAMQPLTTSSSLPPPALAPLSGIYMDDGNLGSIAVTGSQSMPNFGAASPAAADLKEHVINEIVTQLAMVASNNNNSNSSQNHNHNGYMNYQHQQNNVHAQQEQHNLSYTQLNLNSNSNFTSGLGSSPSLPSCAEELLTQDMLSICENSSVYASSEDTGLGGLSESELLPGPHDVDEIPLGDAHLLEEHDLANVLNSLPVDAFSELFTTVRQDEREEVERALELADKHLKSLQQTIGSESDFLGDFLDVNDDILTDTGMCSKMDAVSSVMH